MMMPPDDEMQDKGPFNKDVLENRPEKPLSEENFIHETPHPLSFPFWFWLAIIALISSLIWGTQGWLQKLITQEKNHEPFLEVTNREFSVFLWQFPSFLRSNVSKKTGYLPGFQYLNKETLDLNTTESFVSAPPDLLFLYHTWKRLLASDFIARSISPQEFQEFMEQVPEWQPRYWPSAPTAYKDLVDQDSYLQTENLETLPEEILPRIVRQAFVGWKNYFKEGPEINQIDPTFNELEAFLKQHPGYVRSNWRNIEEVAGQPIAGPHYLSGLLQQTPSNTQVPKEQLPSFLRVALFNASQTQNFINK